MFHIIYYCQLTGQIKERYNNLFTSLEKFTHSKEENKLLNNNFISFDKLSTENSARRLHNLHSQLKVVFKRELKKFIYEYNIPGFIFETFFLRQKTIDINIYKLEDIEKFNKST